MLLITEACPALGLSNLDLPSADLPTIRALVLLDVTFPVPSHQITDKPMRSSDECYWDIRHA
jgi:hypothetical protein